MKKWITAYIFISIFIMLGQITHADPSSSTQFAPLQSVYDSQNATIFIPAVDLVDRFGNTQSFQVWLKIIDNFTFELVNARPLENNLVGARAVYREQEKK